MKRTRDWIIILTFITGVLLYVNIGMHNESQVLEVPIIKPESANFDPYTRHKKNSQDKSQVTEVSSNNMEESTTVSNSSWINISTDTSQVSEVSGNIPEETSIDTHLEETGIPPDNSQESTCGSRSTQRGPHQQVVAYSFYGDINNSRQYFQGIENNTKLIGKFLPGWIVRIYHDIPKSNSEAMEILNNLQKRYDYLDTCYSMDIPGYGNLKGIQEMIWRFLPLGDPLVDTFMSRDLDSRMSDREMAAVNEWLKSRLAFHVMRDHPYHGRPVLGGLWGAQVHMERDLLHGVLQNMLVNGRVNRTRDVDQDVLEQILWKPIKDKVLQHDSYLCMIFARHGHMNSWPTRRPESSYNFVGAVIGMNEAMIKIECPKHCRPQNHQDWIFC